MILYVMILYVMILYVMYTLGDPTPTLEAIQAGHILKSRE
jgi:hypothetical protein